jgi:hypothetical protein
MGWVLVGMDVSVFIKLYSREILPVDILYARFPRLGDSSAKPHIRRGEILLPQDDPVVQAPGREVVPQIIV